MERIHPLRRWRLKNGVTLADLAGREGVDVTPSHLSEVERGLNTLSLDLAAELCRAARGKVKITHFVEWNTRSGPNFRGARKAA